MENNKFSVEGRKETEKKGQIGLCAALV